MPLQLLLDVLCCCCNVTCIRIVLDHHALATSHGHWSCALVATSSKYLGRGELMWRFNCSWRSFVVVAMLPASGSQSIIPIPLSSAARCTVFVDASPTDSIRKSYSAAYTFECVYAFCCYQGLIFPTSPGVGWVEWVRINKCRLERCEVRKSWFDFGCLGCEVRTDINKFGLIPGAKCEMLVKSPDELSVRKFEMRNLLLSWSVYNFKC